MKVALTFAGDPFGVGDTCGLLETTDTAHACYYLVRPCGNNLVYALIGGDIAWSLENESQTTRIEAALEALGRVFGSDVKTSFQGGLASEWGHDPWARGTYSIAKPGHAAARRTLDEPIHGRVHLAGESNAPDGWQGTVSGAYLAGRAATRRVAKSLWERQP